MLLLKNEVKKITKNQVIVSISHNCFSRNHWSYLRTLQLELCIYVGTYAGRLFSDGGKVPLTKHHTAFARWNLYDRYIK